MKGHQPLIPERDGAECQCDIGREKLLTAPPYRLVTSLAYTIEARFKTAPCERDVTVQEHKCPMSHYLVTFRSPQLPSEIFQDVYPAYATVKNIKYKMSTLLCISDTNNLVLAIDRIVLKDPTIVSDLPTDQSGNINIDVFTKDGQHFSLTSIPKEVYAYDLLTAVVPYKKILPYIIVKFRIIANNRSRGTFTQSFLCTRTIGEIKNKLSNIFEEDPDNLILMRIENILPDKMALLHLDYDEFGVVEIQLMTKNNVIKFNDMLKTDKLFDTLPMNDLLTVCVPCGETVKHLKVEIVDDCYKKPYLGGYRNNLTGAHQIKHKNFIAGLIYHHAFTQTPQKKEKLPQEMKNCRDTQTAVEKEQVINTPYSRATQMANDRVFIPNVTDRIMSPKPYETYEEMVKRLNHVHYATIIQKAFRKYQFRKQVYNWLAVCMERIARIKEEERLEQEAMERRLRRDLITKTFPRTREDFDQLYAMLDKWKRSEIQRISSLHSKGPKIAEFSLLLDKEVELLRSIESYRIKVRDDSRKLKNKEFLEEISKPVVWYGRSGKVVAMDTIEIQKARKFKDLYELFCKEHMEVKERLELLAETKLAMEEFFHPLTEEIIYLLDQEADLLVRNYNDKQLEFLKRRTAAAILQFIKTSQLNSGVTKCKDIRDYRKMQDHSLYICEKCCKVKHYSEFQVHSKVTGFYVCKSCSWKDVHERLWIDMTPYKFILRTVQRDERRRKCWGSLAFVLQDRDVFFLVEKLWHCHSAISECDDVTELRLCRWDVTQDWAPWNCFLVTVQEMKAHIKLECPEDVYDEELIKKINNKHQLAKQHFQQLRQVNKNYTETRQWHGVRAPAVARENGVEPI